MNHDTQLQLPFSSLEINFNIYPYDDFASHCIDWWYEASLDAMQAPFGSEEEYYNYLETQQEEDYFTFLDSLDTSTPPNSYAAEPPRSTS